MNVSWVRVSYLLAKNIQCRISPVGCLVQHRSSLCAAGTALYGDSRYPKTCSSFANNPSMNALRFGLSRRLLLGLGLVFVAGLRADNAIPVSVNPGAGQIAISPYIYGTNQDLPGVTATGSRRFGGNPLTGYNWETNASNAGTDDGDQNANYLVKELPTLQQSVPAIALTTFHDQSLASGTLYTVLTLQMAGYVAADESGPVFSSQAA